MPVVFNHKSLWFCSGQRPACQKEGPGANLSSPSLSEHPFLETVHGDMTRTLKRLDTLGMDQQDQQAIPLQACIQ